MLRVSREIHAYQHSHSLNQHRSTDSYLSLKSSTYFVAAVAVLIAFCGDGSRVSQPTS